MSETWIKARTDLAENPKTIAIAARLGQDPDLIVGKLVSKLWRWADKHATLFDGDDPVYQHGRALGTTAWVDQLTGIKGLADALQAEGIDWLRIEGPWLIFPRWAKHNGKSAKTRAENTRRQQRLRDEPATSVAPEARQTRDTSATREEKRRREKTTPAPAAQDQGASPPPAEPRRAGISAEPRQAEQQQDPQTGQEPGSAPSPVGSRLGEVDGSASGEGSVAPGSSPQPPALSASRQSLLASIIATGATGSKPRQIVTAAADNEVAPLAAIVREFRDQCRRDKDLGRTVPGPGLLLTRLDEYLAADADTEQGAAIIAHATDLALRYDADDRARVTRTAHTAQRVAPKRPARDIVTPDGAAVVPGLTDHPAFARLAAGDPA